jgi:hypothetical protein
MKAVSKQKYSKPTLVVYGDIRTLTENAAPTGPKNDGAGTGKTKT